MIPSSSFPALIPQTLLTDDQQHACERLLALARVRANTTEAALPRSVLARWSVPLLIGPAGSGKAFVCEEVARRLGNQPCRRWEVGSWIITANRSSYTTLEQIRAFIESNAAGCVVYLAGVDALAAEVERNVGYYQAIASEVGELLDRVSARSVRFAGPDGNIIRANVLVVVGGCFAALWGEAALGGPSGSEAWQLADAEPLADPAALAKWLVERSGLPAGILRRLAAQPMILHGINHEQAGRLAICLRDHLPPSLDGIGVDEFSAALRSPHGWRAVAALIEQAWVEGHVGLSLPVANSVALPEQNLPPALPKAKSPIILMPACLGEKLGIPSNRSRLLAKARRLRLHTPAALENLAVARGYLLPGEDPQPITVPARVPFDEFTDTELTMTLLSPCLEYSERAICRGAWMLVRFAREETIKRTVNEAHANPVSLAEKLKKYAPVVEANWTSVREYLIRDRCLPATWIDRLHRRGRVWANEHRSACFGHRDLAGNIIGASVRGTTSRFYQTIGDKNDGFFSLRLSQDTPRQIAVVESPIEAISLASLNRDLSTMYASSAGAGGLKPVLELAQRFRLKIVAAQNDDAAGEVQALQSADMCKTYNLSYERVRPPFNDWNDTLKYLHREMRRIIQNGALLPTRLRAVWRRDIHARQLSKRTGETTLFLPEPTQIQDTTLSL